MAGSCRHMLFITGRPLRQVNEYRVYMNGEKQANSVGEHGNRDRFQAEEGEHNMFSHSSHTSIL